MGVGADLGADALARALPGRALRTYPALLSTSADALAWARAGAPAGAVVVADYQAAPRGRAGIEWAVRPGEGLGWSLVLRPSLPADREGWLYTVATSGVADAVGGDAEIAWPDEVHVRGALAGAVGVHAQLGPGGVEWAVVTALVHEARPPRAALLAEVVTAVERHATEAPAQLLAAYRERCSTLGQSVRARLIPVGPSGPEVSGRAVDCLPDGALVLRTPAGSRVAVRPQHLGVLESDSDRRP